MEEGRGGGKTETGQGGGVGLIGGGEGMGRGNQEAEGS